MSLIQSTAIPSGASAYELDQSLRFNDNDSAYLSKTFASAGNRKTWSFSCWFKRGNIGGTNNVANKDCIFGGINGDNLIRIGDDFLQWYNYDGSADYGWISEAVFRDTSAWYHALWVLDTTNSTATQRQRIYLNGIELTAKSTDYGNPPLNFQGLINSAGVHTIGVNTSVLDQWFDGYLSEVNFVDGQALTPADFAETGTYGEWKPKEYSGSYGANGFYLNFAGGGIMAATGGTVSTDGDYKVHQFTSSGTFTPTSINNGGDVEYLVIAGGGSGGGEIAGGGGAGGYRTGYLAVEEQGYAITVGAGGAQRGGSQNPDAGNNGANSIFGAITSIGGGGGGGPTGSFTVGRVGGSGGGEWVGGGSGGAAGTSGQGNAGGTGAGSTFGNGAGGGGAGAVGANGGKTENSGTQGAGGAGTASSITGSAVTRAGGGGGGTWSNSGQYQGGNGGAGGGGEGWGNQMPGYSTNAGGNGNPGTANTGSGGGGSGNGGSHAGGAGGSGIVIIRYKFQ